MIKRMWDFKKGGVVMFHEFVVVLENEYNNEMVENYFSFEASYGFMNNLDRAVVKAKEMIEYFSNIDCHWTLKEIKVI